MSAASQAPVTSIRKEIDLTVHLAPDLPSFESLGIDSAADLLAEGLPSPRTRVLVSEPHYERMLFPLPGTPLDSGGAMLESPRGAGTGWVQLERWRSVPLRTLFGLRFGNPRSRCPAERHWNLLCHLRAQGVGTPEPLAVGARGNGLVSRDSFLVTRAFMEGTLSLDQFLAGAGDQKPTAEAVARAASALSATLRALGNARVQLPHLGAKGLCLRFPPQAKDPEALPEKDTSCGLTQLANWRTDRALGSLGRDPRPAVFISDVTGGRLLQRADGNFRGALLDSIEASLRKGIGPGAGQSDLGLLMRLLRADWGEQST